MWKLNNKRKKRCNKTGKIKSLAHHTSNGRKRTATVCNDRQKKNICKQVVKLFTKSQQESKWQLHSRHKFTFTVSVCWQTQQKKKLKNNRNKLERKLEIQRNQDNKNKRKKTQSNYQTVSFATWDSLNERLTT